MIKNFDLTGWTLFSERRNSQNYYSDDKKWMIKISTEVTDRPVEEMEKEIEITKKALEVGIKTPLIGDIVELPDGRKGIMYEYVEGKKSISRAYADEPDKMEEYTERFAKMAKEFHSRTCDPSKFVSMEEKAIRNVKKWGLFPGEYEKKALDLIASIEKTNNCLHGDFQPSNFIIAGDREFVIDLGGICYGNPIYDVGFLYYFTNLLHDGPAQGALRCERKDFIRIWNTFAKVYYDLKTDEELTKLNNKLVKYALTVFPAVFDQVDPGADIVPLKETYAKTLESAFANEELI